MSAHILIVGNSMTGKSNLAKRFADDHTKPVIIYDPIKSTGWPKNAKKFADPGLFLDEMKKAKSSFIFVDEAKSLWDYDIKEADRLLYNRRHQGLLITLIAQRTRMVPPNARNQCSRVFAFRQQKIDADILAEEYHEEMQKCRNLKPGEFIATNGFSAEILTLDYSKIYPPKIKTG